MTTPGFKRDSGKPRWDLLPWDAALAIVKVMTSACLPLADGSPSKYPNRNWEAGLPASKLYRAAIGHLTSWWQGEDLDAEWGHGHLAHGGCCVLFMIALEMRKKAGFDDRPSTAKETTR